MSNTRSAVNELLKALARTYEACVAIDMDSRIIGVNDNYLKLVEKDRDEIWVRERIRIPNRLFDSVGV